MSREVFLRLKGFGVKRRGDVRDAISSRTGLLGTLLVFWFLALTARASAGPWLALGAAGADGAAGAPPA